jgi:hypothetical protein
MESLSDEITNAFDDKERELTKHRDTMHRHEAIVSEKSALYNHDMQSIRSKKQRMDALKSSIDKTREVVRQVRSFEERNDEDPIPNHITENNPEELLAHLTKRVESIQGRSIEGISPEMIKAILKKIFYLVRTMHAGVSAVVLFVVITLCGSKYWFNRRCSFPSLFFSSSQKIRIIRIKICAVLAVTEGLIMKLKSNDSRKQ